MELAKRHITLGSAILREMGLIINTVILGGNNTIGYIGINMRE